MVTDNGVLVTLGNIHQQEDRLLVAGSIEVGPLIAGGRTYVLEKIDGEWQITGTAGLEWLR
jgi:hypothetical protein